LREILVPVFLIHSAVFQNIVVLPCQPQPLFGQPQPENYNFETCSL
jgi:hypothetical protein